MDNLYNVFVVRGKDDKVLQSESDQSSMEQYGRMVYQVTDEEADESKALEMIENFLKTKTVLTETFNVECLGNHFDEMWRSDPS